MAPVNCAHVNPADTWRNNNDNATSFWRNNYIITSCVRWEKSGDLQTVTSSALEMLSKEELWFFAPWQILRLFHDPWHDPYVKLFGMWNCQAATHPKRHFGGVVGARAQGDGNRVVSVSQLGSLDLLSNHGHTQTSALMIRHYQVTLIHEFFKSARNIQIQIAYYHWT